MITIDQSAFKPGKNSISFTTKGYRIAADLYLPEGFETAPCPAIIFARPATQVKEQASVVYGEKMSARGYALLAVDHIGFGESEGEIRNYENTENIIAVLTDGITVLRHLDCIDENRIYGMGLCMGGAYITRLAFLDKRLKAIATMSAYFDCATAFEQMMDEETRGQAILGANLAMEKYLQTGEVDRYPVLGAMKPGEIPEGTPRYYADAVDYYMTSRGALEHAPNYSNMLPAFQLPIDPALNHSPYGDQLTLPKLFIRGSDAAITGPLTDLFYPNAAEPKELMVVEGAEHFDLYDIDQYVDPVIDRVDTFFKAN
ncbi:alpha/beta superfamily hydrolase [Pseudovibrio sp. FO-BEG1]|uniref:alpha/beta hydrolase n=1 Tax=Pseudovibrio sp. (strain FO-BEG1) TaxID=911045 RepID=UPI000238D316|nr:alpha/beta hydrolase [Pseudovibrio sp. FO-BEG1]AEV35175.1 alpha/beta superfamily hydrolase [Pseudovibrio sp. FO-BEG1]